MPWTVCDAMSQRREFVALAGAEGAKVSEPCRRFGISRKCGYKWLALAVPAGRYRASPRAFPEVLPAIEYDSGLAVR